jgi:hypothetical protein
VPAGHGVPDIRCRENYRYPRHSRAGQPRRATLQVAASVIFGGIWQGIFGIILHARVRVISKAVTPIDECHLPRTICHQDPRRCAEGMNGLVKVGCPATTTLGTRSGANNLWEPVTPAAGKPRQTPGSPHISGDIYRWGHKSPPAGSATPAGSIPSVASATGEQATVRLSLHRYLAGSHLRTR